MTSKLWNDSEVMHRRVSLAHFPSGNRYTRLRLYEIGNNQPQSMHRRHPLCLPYGTSLDSCL